MTATVAVAQSDVAAFCAFAAVSASPASARSIAESPAVSARSVADSPTVSAMECGVGLSPAVSAAAQKVLLQEQNRVLEKWLAENANTLYPTREQKDRIAADMGMTYLQVNRWFANRRRKQSKRTKTTTQPSGTIDGAKSSTSDSEKSITTIHEVLRSLNSLNKIFPLPQPSVSTPPQPQTKPHQPTPTSSASSSSSSASGSSSAAGSTSDFLLQTHALALKAQQAESAQKRTDTDVEMFPQNYDRNAVTPPAIEDPMATVNMLFSQHHLGQSSSSLTQLVYSLMTANPSAALSLLQQLRQLQIQQHFAALQRQQLEQLETLRAHAAILTPTENSPVQQSTCIASTATAMPTTAIPPASFMSPPASASPSESVSDISTDLSPRPSSPPFKDPCRLADPQMTKILSRNLSDFSPAPPAMKRRITLDSLTENEQIAIAALTALATRR